jgi:hypothetical protein
MGVAATGQKGDEISIVGNPGPAILYINSQVSSSILTNFKSTYRIFDSKPLGVAAEHVGSRLRQLLEFSALAVLAVGLINQDQWC